MTVTVTTIIRITRTLSTISNCSLILCIPSYQLRRAVTILPTLIFCISLLPQKWSFSVPEVATTSLSQQHVSINTFVFNRLEMNIGLQESFAYEDCNRDPFVDFFRLEIGCKLRSIVQSKGRSSLGFLLHYCNGQDCCRKTTDHYWR